MAHRSRTTESEVILEPDGPAKAAVILLHGLGADGLDFVPFVGELALDDAFGVRWIFPHAPMRPVTVNAGYVMRAWYDIRSFTPERRADASGLAESVDRAFGYLREEIAREVPASRIVLAGFSQGGAVALSAALRFPERLAGILAMSAYLPFPERIAGEISWANVDVPVLMCHGRNDSVVPIEMGREARDVLVSNGQAVEWREYAMDHEVCGAELAEIARWLRGVLGHADG